jgi:hypothetical protein
MEELLTGRELATPHAYAAVSLYRPRQPLTMGPTVRILFAPAESHERTVGRAADRANIAARNCARADLAEPVGQN